MAAPDETPVPPEDIESGALCMTDPKTGKMVAVKDMRAEFERMSRQVPRDPEAERAFIESKINIIRTDTHLSDAEKRRAIDELRRPS